MREVPTKNYLIVFFMAIGVVVLGFVLRRMYLSNNDEVYDSVVKEVILEIQYEDLENYLQENLDFVLYINDSSKKTNKELDKAIKKLVTDNSISRYIVYIEKNDEVVDKYDLDSNSPIFIAYQNGIITEILSKDNYKISEIESFLVRNKVIEND